MLVVAGAGTGKTRTLVERCLSLVLDNGPTRANIDEILLVTFTEAAAAEMRKRIRARLEERARGPLKQQCVEQLALMEAAHIGTLHSFCFKLVRQHFYELELDPQINVMREEESGMLATGTLDKVLRSFYSGTGPLAERVRQLVRTHGAGSDEPVRKAMLRLHNYMQTLADPAGWVEGQTAMLGDTEPTRWERWLTDAIPQWRDEWREFLEALPKENKVAQNCLTGLGKITEASTNETLANVVQELESAFAGCARGKKGAWLDPLKKFQEDVAFFTSLLVASSGSAGEPLTPSPLVQDWQWTRGPLATLLEATCEFSKKYSAEKRELAAVDFHDLEQHALKLLWDSKEGKPTAIAREWRERLKYVFVDEYQDINNAQDKIIQALSRDGKAANRFLVGDAKQSIYRFRLASPGIFREYTRTWTGCTGTTVPLVENFRSREALIALANSIFRRIMPAELGGIDYSTQALEFGAPADRKQLSENPGDEPVAELHLRIKENGQAANEDEEQSTWGEILDAEKEARIVASRFLELHKAKTQVWDDDSKAFRAVRWSDMAILLRAPSRKAESYAKAFDYVGVPLQSAKRGFYDSSEICDLLSLLQALDNPLQDVPLIATLRSPFASLGLEEIAGIRLAAKRVRFWNALVAWQRSAQARNAQNEQAMLAKVNTFLDRFSRWRNLTRQSQLSTCIETILAETCYCEWLQVQPRGPQRYANLQRFVGLAREFDQFQRRGLLRFLAYVDAQKECAVEPEVAAAEDLDAVRLMSIHQSKGLEFPIVAVPDLAKPFNTTDLKSDIFLSEAYGLCSQVRPPQSRRKYPSLPLWLARRNERRELLGEELRLLYVAITRARDRLILSATIGPKSLQTFQTPAPSQGMASLLGARSCADWLGYWAGNDCPIGNDPLGVTGCLAWRIHTQPAADTFKPDSKTGTDAPDAGDSTEPAFPSADLIRKLDWSYPHAAATIEPAKSSVSILRRRFPDDAESPVHQFVHYKQASGEDSTAASPLRAADRGNAHHAFLEFVSLERPSDADFLREECSRLVEEGKLTSCEAEVLDFDGIAAFWESDTGREILEHRDKVERELSFTARFEASELARYVPAAASPDLENEFVIIQGIADLAVILPGEIWLLDFKTDRIDAREIEERAKTYTPQLRIYSDALSRIYGRPTTRAALYFITPRKVVPV